MRFTKIILSLLSFLLLAGFANAAVEVINVAGDNSVINHGDSFTLSFGLKNNDAIADVTNFKFFLPDVSSIGKWTSLKAGVSDLSLETPTIPRIDKNGDVIRVEAGFTSNKHTPARSIQDSINDEESRELLKLKIEVRSTPTLAITKIRELNLTSVGRLNITNTGNVDFTRDLEVNLSSGGDFGVTMSQSKFLLIAGSSQIVDITPLNIQNLKFGANTVTITAKTGEVQQASSFSIEKSFCNNGPAGLNLSIDNINWDNEGQDDDIWKPIDKINLEVRVENDGDVDINDVVIEFGLFDSSGKNNVGDLDFINDEDEKIEVGDINDNNDETANFEFIVPADFDSGTYKLAVKAYSKDLGQSNVCADRSSDLASLFFESIKVEKEDDEQKFITFDNIKLRPTEVTCGDSVSLTADAFNIGNEDQDKVKVTLTNEELKINTASEIKQGLDQGDKQSLIFNFDIPTNAKDKTYLLELNSEYDYRNGLYRESSEESFTVSMNVFGCSVSQGVQNQLQGTQGKLASISASLDSDAEAGKEMIVSSTIRNLGNSTNTFLVSASGYDSWAELNDISERILALDVGQSKEVIFTFLVNKDAEGEQAFEIEVRTGSYSEKREVSADIAKSESSVSSIFAGNSLLWIVGIVNVVLILLIIMVALRISKR